MHFKNYFNVYDQTQLVCKLNSFSGEIILFEDLFCFPSRERTNCRCKDRKAFADVKVIIKYLMFLASRISALPPPDNSWLYVDPMISHALNGLNEICDNVF